MNPKPPTLYAIMNSIANYDAEEKTKIRNLAKATHEKIFDFDYPFYTNDKDEIKKEAVKQEALKKKPVVPTK